MAPDALQEHTSNAGSFNSLWVADRIDLLLAPDIRFVVVDTIYDDFTSNMSYPKDREVKRRAQSNAVSSPV